MLVVGDILMRRKQLFRNNEAKVGVGLFASRVAFYLAAVFVLSLISQGFGYLIGYFILGA